MAGSNDSTLKALEEIQDERQDELLELQNVVGVGLGNKVTGDHDTEKPCLTVFVSQKLNVDQLHSADRVPRTISKLPTDVQEIGEVFAGQEAAPAEEPTGMEVPLEVGAEALRARIRPVEGGYSVGNFRITAGTYATAVRDLGAAIPRRYYVLSNNHVLANSNAARIGDPILQPGPADGGTRGDVIARLSRFVPIRFGSGLVNYVDAAIAEGPFHVLDREIYWIGYVKGVVKGIPGVTVGTRVQKSGRTTNYTTGRVRAINATINVNYGGSRVARFVRQILTTNMSAPGDSGSLLLDMDRRAVGLLFAGSSSVTVHNPISYVQRLLRIQVA